MSEVAVKESYFYDEDTKQKFVESYFKTGKLSLSARDLSVNYETAKAWGRSDWFSTALAKVKSEHDRQMEGRMTSLIDKAMVELQERLEHGEERITKTGEIKRVKGGIAALTIAMGTLVDKRQIIRTGGVTTTSDDVLLRLAEKLRDFAKPVVIEATDIDFKVK